MVEPFKPTASASGEKRTWRTSIVVAVAKKIAGFHSHAIVMGVQQLDGLFH